MKILGAMWSIFITVVLVLVVSFGVYVFNHMVDITLNGNYVQHFAVGCDHSKQICGDETVVSAVVMYNNGPITMTGMTPVLLKDFVAPKDSVGAQLVISDGRIFTFIAPMQFDRDHRKNLQ